eukprot:m.275964 g.275964  ORF g.275964 m.275964 type:complete len:107 (+) comp15703_c0_seq3:52-372(+)
MRLIIALPLMLLCCAAPTSGDYLVVIESAIVPDNGTYSVSVQWTYETDTTQPSLGPDPVFNHTVPLPANKVVQFLSCIKQHYTALKKGESLSWRVCSWYIVLSIAR